MEEGQNEDVSAIKDSFEIEKDNLLDKLNNLNISMRQMKRMRMKCLKNMKFQKKMKMLIISKKNGTRKIIFKLMDNIIGDL